jgi:cytochrome c heme-lyase
MGNSVSTSYADSAPAAPPRACPVTKSTGSKCPFGFVSSADAGPATPPSEPVDAVVNANNMDQIVNNSVENNEPLVCPVKNKKSNVDSNSSIQSVSSKTNSASESLCPVIRKNNSDGNTYVNKDQFNVYGQKIDPRNNMPSVANQQPAPGQPTPLSTERVKSNIPKGGTADETWTYPSPQMFWNALVRKNKTENVEEIKEMENVVAIHNNMNEKTWLQVLEWENINSSVSDGPGKEPKLLRFTGRPDELSPKAKIKAFFWQPEPFDRHDWIVDRGGTQVRYVIDYYIDDDTLHQDNVPKHLTDMHSVKSIRVDARPALDSAKAIYDRVVYMPILRLLGRSKYSPPPFFQFRYLPFFTNENKSISPKLEQTFSDNTDILKKNWEEIQNNCKTIEEELSKSTENDANGKSIELRKCKASVVCPDLVEAFDESIKSRNLENVEQAYIRMRDCVDSFDNKFVGTSSK